MVERIEVTTAVGFKPWRAPNYALLDMGSRQPQEVPRDMPAIAVDELAPEVLDALAQTWLDDVYDKAGRPCPFVLPPAKR